MNKNIVYAISVGAGIFIPQKYTVRSQIWAENYPLLFYVLRGESLEILVSQFWVKNYPLLLLALNHIEIRVYHQCWVKKLSSAVIPSKYAITHD